MNIAVGIDATNSWYSEISLYVFENEEPDISKTGHFTQVIWNSSLELGCGFDYKETTDSYQITVVCNYKAAGNIIGQFKNNVFKLQ